MMHVSRQGRTGRGDMCERIYCFLLVSCAFFVLWNGERWNFNNSENGPGLHVAYYVGATTYAYTSPYTLWKSISPTMTDYIINTCHHED